MLHLFTCGVSTIITGAASLYKEGLRRVPLIAVFPKRGVFFVAKCKVDRAGWEDFTEYRK
jgi:hypothetical protein